jgi:hypothetical protein
MMIIREEIHKCLEEIHNDPNKHSVLCKQFTKFVNYEIAMYRYTFLKMHHTNVGRWANQAANYLQKRLNYSLKIGVN